MHVLQVFSVPTSLANLFACLHINHDFMCMHSLIIHVPFDRNIPLFFVCSQGTWRALLCTDFDGMAQGSKTYPTSTDTPSKNESRKRDLKKQKRAAKARAAATAAEKAAAAQRAKQALVPYGSFKAVPIKWESDVLADARRMGDPRATPAVEREHVRDLYNTVADDWHRTRWKAWPRVTQFVASLDVGSVIVDVGCGNGKNLPACDEVGFGVGCDISSSLIQICRQRGFEVAVADAMILPYKTDAFDAALSIAVMHHLSTVPRRVRALAELGRVLRPNGRALVYVRPAHTSLNAPTQGLRPCTTIVCDVRHEEFLG